MPTFFKRLTTALLLASTLASFAQSKQSCGISEFFFEKKGCCVKHGGDRDASPPPSGKRCPKQGWLWHSGQSCCVPKTPTDATVSNPSCDDDDFAWNDDSVCCERRPKRDSDCDRGQFFFSQKRLCLPKGGVQSTMPPPKNKMCPSKKGWSWHSGGQCCVPSNPLPANSTPPSCDNDDYAWNSDSLCCEAKPSKDSDCDRDSFYFAQTRSCIPKGGPKNVSSPPRNKDCPPTGWAWDSDSQACLPTYPMPDDAPAPTCRRQNFFWDADSLFCAFTPDDPTDCADNEFFFAAKKLCLPRGGRRRTGSAPGNKKCPTSGNWSWHTTRKCCVPQDPQPTTNPDLPICDGGYYWNTDRGCCDPNPTQVSDCTGNTFPFAPIPACIQNGGIANPPSPPAGVMCPRSWWWYSSSKVCVPMAPLDDPPTPPACDKSGWAFQESTLSCRQAASKRGHHKRERQISF